MPGAHSWDQIAASDADVTFPRRILAQPVPTWLEKPQPTWAVTPDGSPQRTALGEFLTHRCKHQGGDLQSDLDFALSLPHEQPKLTQPPEAPLPPAVCCQRPHLTKSLLSKYQPQPPELQWSDSRPCALCPPERPHSQTDGSICHEFLCGSREVPVPTAHTSSGSGGEMSSVCLHSSWWRVTSL